MKIDLTETQWSDIKIVLLQAITHTDKNSKKENYNFNSNQLVRRYLKTHDQIAEATNRKQNKCSKSKDL